MVDWIVNYLKQYCIALLSFALGYLARIAVSMLREGVNIKKLKGKGRTWLIN